MISIISTRDVVTFTLVASLLFSLVPFGAQAQRPAGENKGDFCSNIDSARDTAMTRISNKRAESDRSHEVQTKKESRLEALEKRRAERDAAREARYDSLRDKASTDEQTAAVEEFVDTVESLMDTRRAAVDAAIEDFEDAVTDILAERDDLIAAGANDLEEAVDEIFDTAEAACDDDGDGKEVRAAFMADMKALRESMKAERGDYAFKDELATAKSERKAAIEAAQAEFKAGVEDAKEDLRAAFAGDS